MSKQTLLWAITITNSVLILGFIIFVTLAYFAENNDYQNYQEWVVEENNKLRKYIDSSNDDLRDYVEDSVNDLEDYVNDATH